MISVVFFMKLLLFFCMFFSSESIPYKIFLSRFFHRNASFVWKNRLIFACNLKNREISEEMFIDIFQNTSCQFTKKLDISWSTISDGLLLSLPKTIEELSLARVKIRSSGNIVSIQNYIKPLFARLPNLRVLDLSFHGLENSDIDFSNFFNRSLGSKIEVFILKNNHLDIQAIANFAHFPELRSLDLSDNSMVSLAEFDFQGLLRDFYFPKLESLSLRNSGMNAIVADNEEYSAFLLSLKKLDLSDNGIRDAVLGSIFETPAVKSSELQVLNLSGNHLTGKGMRYLALLPNLTDLDLSNNLIHNFDLDGFGDSAFNKLERLKINNNFINNDVFKNFPAFSELIALDLRDNAMDKVDYRDFIELLCLSRLPKIKNIQLRLCRMQNSSLSLMDASFSALNPDRGEDCFVTNVSRSLNEF